MESLESNNFILDKNKLHLYFNKFQYKINLRLVGIEYFRYVNDVSDFESRLESSVAISEYGRWMSRSASYIYSSLQEILTNRVNFSKSGLMDFIEWKSLRDVKNDHMIKISRGNVDVYSTNLDVINLIKNIAEKNNITYQMYYVKETEYERNVVYLKKPKNSNRVYLRYNRLDLDKTAKLVKFLDLNNFIMSKSLKQSLTRRNNPSHMILLGPPKYHLLFDHHYVEFNDEKMITLLSLSYPELIRKICRIEKR